MAIQVSGTSVINDSRQLQNIASVDSTTAASITAAGVGGTPGLTRISSASISNVANFSFSGFNSSNYQSYILILDAIIPGSTPYANKMYMFTTTDGSTTNKQDMTAAAYYNTSNGVLGSYGTQSNDNTIIHKQVNNLTNHGASAIIEITNPAVSGKAVAIHAKVVGRENASNDRTTAHNVFAMPNSASSDISLIGFFFEYTNTISGTITAYGLANS